MPDFPFAASRTSGRRRGPADNFLRVTVVTQEALDRAEAFTAADLPCLLVGIGQVPAGKLDFAAVAALHHHLATFLVEQVSAIHRSFADHHRKILERSDRIANHHRLVEAADVERAPADGTPPARLGERLRAARKAMKLKQWEIERCVGLEKGTVSQIELGRWLPADDRLHPIAEALKLAHRELCELADADRAGRKMRKRRVRRIPA